MPVDRLPDLVNEECYRTQRVGGSDFLLGPGRLLEWPGFAGEVKGLV